MSEARIYIELFKAELSSQRYTVLCEEGAKKSIAQVSIGQPSTWHTKDSAHDA